MPFKIDKIYSIDEDKIKNDKDLKCGTECLFKFNFQEQSTSYKACVSLTDNDIKIPHVSITNQFLSNTQNTGTIAVNFQNDNYWFDSIYITKPGQLLMDNKIAGMYDKKVSSSDLSACSLLIVCYNGNNKYVTIVQNIISRQSVVNNSRGSVITEVIRDITNRSSRADISFNSKICSETDSSSLSISPININNLIPTNDNFFFYPKESTTFTYNYLVFSASKPILITDAMREIIEDFFTPDTTSSASSTQLVVEELPVSSSSTPSTPSVFFSSQLPINTLAEGEDDIYIRCQPTNQEGEMLVSGESVTTPTEELNLGSMLDLNNNWFTSAVLGVVIMLIIIKGGEFLLSNGTRALLGGD
jgi:hypothetical protein